MSYKSKCMQQSNKILLKENLVKFLTTRGHENDLSKYAYIIQIDESDTKELSGYMEQVLNFKVLPKIINQEIQHSKMLDILVTPQNDIPLWIGVKVKEKEIHLIISKRFKKLKVVKQGHINNVTIPFVDRKNLKLT